MARALLFLLYWQCWIHSISAAVLSQPKLVSIPLPSSLVERDECGTPPAELQMNATGQFPDGSYGCTINPDDPDPFGSQKQCQMTCAPDTVGSQEGVGPAIVCVGANWPGNSVCAGQPIKSLEITLGKCHCGAPVIEYIIKEVVIALPKISAIGCLAFFGALETVSEWTTKLTRTDLLLEGVSAVVEGFASLSVSAPTDIDVVPMVFDWLTQNICDTSSLSYDLKSEIEKTFGAIISFGADRGIKTGPKRPSDQDENESPSESAQPAPRPDPTVSPTNDAASQTQSAAASTFTTSSTPAPACGLVKRARETGKSTWSSCDNNGNIHSTVVTTMKFAGQESTFPATCSSSWSHACVHYSSVIANNPRWEALKCDDSLGVSSVPDSRVINDFWDKQHHDDWLDEKYREEPNCDRDEWPPAYFFLPSDPVIQNKEQLVRFLPRSDNRGAQSMWRQFCWLKGLAAADNQMSLEQKNQPDSSESSRGADGKTTTTFTTSVSMSISYKPVFSIASYEIGNLDATNHGLLENPCIPFGITDDWLFPLLKNDPEVNNGAHWLHDYSQPPDAQVLANAVDFDG